MKKDQLLKKIPFYLIMAAGLWMLFGQLNLSGLLPFGGGHKDVAPVAQAVAPTKVLASSFGGAAVANQLDALESGPPKLDMNVTPDTQEALPTDEPAPAHQKVALYDLKSNTPAPVDGVTLFYAYMENQGKRLISTGEGWFDCGQVPNLAGVDADHWARLQPQTQQEVTNLCSTLKGQL